MQLWQQDPPAAPDHPAAVFWKKGFELRDVRRAFQFLSTGLIAVAKDSHRVIAQWNAKRRLCYLRDLQDRLGPLARIARLLAVHSFQVASHHSHRGALSFNRRGITHRCPCPIRTKATR